LVLKFTSSNELVAQLNLDMKKSLKILEKRHI
jgi:hypothetical protein